MVRYGMASTRRAFWQTLSKVPSVLGHARPDDFYVGAERAVKYGVLFVALTFLACFVLERFGG